jgi:hypothetical protein
MSVYICHAFIFLDPPPPWPSRTHSNMDMKKMKGNEVHSYNVNHRRLCPAAQGKSPLSMFIYFVAGRYCWFSQACSMGLLLAVLKSSKKLFSCANVFSIMYHSSEGIQSAYHPTAAWPGHGIKQRQLQYHFPPSSYLVGATSLQWRGEQAYHLAGKTTLSHCTQLGLLSWILVLAGYNFYRGTSWHVHCSACCCLPVRSTPWP